VSSAPPFPVQLAHWARDMPEAARLRWRALERPDARGLAAGEGRPVVLLPGVYETWHFLEAIGAALHAAGHPVHVLPALRRNRYPIESTARWVGAELRRRGLRDVVLVAHSKGGLVGKQVLRRYDPEGRVAGLVAVASPFAGSSRADYMVLPALRHFRPRDPFIRELAADRAVDARIISIFPSYDPHIPQGSRLGAGADVEVPVIGHFRILRDPRTISAVLAAVESAPAASRPVSASRERGS